jgi:hypothetical protein
MNPVHNGRVGYARMDAVDPVVVPRQFQCGTLQSCHDGMLQSGIAGGLRHRRCAIFIYYGIPVLVDWEYRTRQQGIMKTTVNIPDGDLADAMRFTKAKTKREAIVTAIREFNRRKRMAELTKHAGTCTDLASVEELLQRRRKG